MFADKSDAISVIEKRFPRANIVLSQLKIDSDESRWSIRMSAEPGHLERRVNQIDSVTNREDLE